MRDIAHQIASPAKKPGSPATYVGLTLKNAGYTAHLLLKSAGDVAGWTKPRLFLQVYMQVLHKKCGILRGSVMQDDS